MWLTTCTCCCSCRSTLKPEDAGTVGHTWVSLFFFLFFFHLHILCSFYFFKIINIITSSHTQRRLYVGLCGFQFICLFFLLFCFVYLFVCCCCCLFFVCLFVFCLVLFCFLGFFSMWVNINKSNESVQFKELVGVVCLCFCKHHF